MKRLLAFGLIVFFCASAQAVVFRRDILTIIPKPTPIALDENDQPLDPQPEPRESFRFYTDLRDEGALKLNWMVSLNRINAKRTMTIVFSAPRYDVIKPQPVYELLDILSVSPEGVITQIMPNLALADLSQPITTARLARARLVLAGGAVQTLGLRVGDRVQHPIFSPAPEVVTE